ncbi:hypothetical protein FOL47_009986 [Perkinsus chesapeaki]|uniref:Uncharacterized protein n=1 Tax=Perkinsus chesapeaki TaxID=330153 RepID=A0A7J6L5F7_PERCH|nr:hypothetical protein FOL47_009986 [Perkinsus chesapeaki]
MWYLACLPVLTIAVISHQRRNQDAADSSTMWTDYCEFLNGPGSVCSQDVCSVGGQACGDESVATTPTPSTQTGVTDPQASDPLRIACDSYCQTLNGDASFCKLWFESPVCQYGDQPCGTLEICGDAPRYTIPDKPVEYSAEWNEYCRYLNGPVSSCTGTCTGGGQPCGRGNAPVVTPTTAPVLVTTTTAAPPTAETEVQPVTEKTADAGCDEFCKSLNGETSFCKWWNTEPVCHLGDQPCGSSTACNGDGIPAVTPVVVDTNVEEAPTETVQVAAPEDAVQRTCDAFCAQLNGETSFCKWWHASPVCQYGDQPCGTIDLCGDGPSVNVTKVSPMLPKVDGTHYASCDKMCQSLNDATSYCKWWMNSPVCQHGDQPCGDVSVCESETWPSPAAPTLPPGAHSQASVECDSMCKNLNGDGSYCKWWRSVPVCHGGDQPCGPGECDGVPVVSPETVRPTPQPALRTDPPAPVKAAPSAPVVSKAHSMPNAKCDAYCAQLNDAGSYCKWWKDIPVCKGGDQSCAAEICDDGATSR